VGLLGGAGLAGFARAEPELRAYISPFGPALTFALRAAGGYYHPLPIEAGVSTEPPPLLRFYSGGANSMRGFYTRTLGQVEVRPDGRLRPLGGTWFYEASLEARLRLGDHGFTLFADAGDVQGAPDGLLASELVAGLGYRYKSPVGPIRVDVAARLTPQRERCFALSGAELAPTACPADANVGIVYTPGAEGIILSAPLFFLSIGQAF
jgi:outer membrane translocation and assembly module TamA